MSVTVRIDLSEFDRAWKEKTEAFKAAVRRALEEVGALIKDEMQGNAPFRTGALRSSIQVQVEDTRALIGPTVKYAPYVEFGTQASPGRYVPAIAKRLVNPALPHFGMHPGIKGQYYVTQTAAGAGPTVEAVFQEILRQVME